MKIIYELTIVQQLVEERHKAEDLGKVINYAELSELEIRQLHRESFSWSKSPYESVDDLTLAINIEALVLVGISIRSTHQ